MESLLSNLANNLTEGIHKIKSKYTPDVKAMNFAEINTKRTNTFLNTKTLKMI